MRPKRDDTSVWWFLTAGLLTLSAVLGLAVGAIGADGRDGPARTDVVLNSIGADTPKSTFEARYGGRWSLHRTPSGVVGVHHD